MINGGGGMYIDRLEDQQRSDAYIARRDPKLFDAIEREREAHNRMMCKKMDDFFKKVFKSLFGWLTFKKSK